MNLQLSQTSEDMNHRRAVLAAIIAAVLLILGQLGAAANNAEPVAPAFPDGAASTAQYLADFAHALDGCTPMAGFFAPDAVLVFTATGERVQGEEAVVAVLDDLLHGAFAGRFDVADRAIGGEGAAEAGHFVGTHIGPYYGTAATGATVRVPYAAVYELSGGRITELRLDLPTVEILAQLVTAPAAEAVEPGRSGKPV